MNIQGFSIDFYVNHFLAAPEHSKLPEANMERRAGVSAVGLLHHDDINSPGEGGRVDLIVEVSEVADELANVVHAVHGSGGRVLPGVTACLTLEPQSEVRNGHGTAKVLKQSRSTREEHVDLISQTLSPENDVSDSYHSKYHSLDAKQTSFLAAQRNAECAAQRITSKLPQHQLSPKNITGADHQRFPSVLRDNITIN